MKVITVAIWRPLNKYYYRKIEEYFIFYFSGRQQSFLFFLTIVLIEKLMWSKIKTNCLFLACFKLDFSKIRELKTISC